VQEDIPRRRTQRPSNQLPVPSNPQEDTSSPPEGSLPITDLPLPSTRADDSLDQPANWLDEVDLSLAITILDQVSLPPICVNWHTGFQFLVHIFNPDKLFATRIRTFRYIPGEVRPLFRQCYIGVLTLLDNLPDPAGPPTADFVYQRVLSF
jgi:hypothetical protein